MLPAQIKNRFPCSELPGLALLFVALLFNGWYAAPELRIGRVPLNDTVFHLAASERLGKSIAEGEPFLNPWVSEWALGYPVWQSYQPLGHLVAAAAFRVFGGVATNEAIFATINYMLIVFFPLSVYLGARLLGIGTAASGLAALLVFAPSATGDPERYGLGYGSVLWRGSGLYTQLFALNLLAIGIGLTARALDMGGRMRLTVAGLMLSLTSLSHIIFGYAAFVSAALLAVVGTAGERPRRLVRFVFIATIGLVLLAWFLIPMVLVKETIGHNRWEPTQKWDSYGASYIIGELFSGRLLDYGRPPLLTALLALGIVGIWLARHEPAARRLAGLCGLWLMLFFGRTTWGQMMLLAGIPADLHMQRLQAVFELTAIMMTAYGAVRFLAAIARYTSYIQARLRRAYDGKPHGISGTICVVIGAAAIAAVVIAIGADRASYLDQNLEWGEQNLEAYAQQHSELNAAMLDIRAILAERPGRVYAGRANGWGRDFKVGWMPVYTFLSREHFDQTSFLYHSMSKTSDVIFEYDESSAFDVAFGIRAVVAPTDRIMPPHLRLRGTHGEFAVYESPSEGYFGLVDIGGQYTGPAPAAYELNYAWLKSSLPGEGIVFSLERISTGLDADYCEAISALNAKQTRQRGQIIAESKAGETYSAHVQMLRPAYVLIKITWHPYLTATVDGRPVPLIPVTPGFGAVPVQAGDHQVEVTFRPGPLKAILLIAGICVFTMVCIFISV